MTRARYRVEIILVLRESCNHTLRCHSTWLETGSTIVNQIGTVGSSASNGAAPLPWLRDLP